jgi:hypothetical protein
VKIDHEKIRKLIDASKLFDKKRKERMKKALKTASPEEKKELIEILEEEYGIMDNFISNLKPGELDKFDQFLDSANEKLTKFKKIQSKQN